MAVLTKSLRALAPWLLLVGYLPSLTFLGHVPLDFNIPGTTWYIGMPEIAGHSGHNDSTAGMNGNAASEHLHDQHCHTDMGSCSDAPYTGSASFALVAAVITLLGAATAAFALTARWWRPSFAISAPPLVPPPRTPLPI
jgi:hypothetical protein